MKVALVPMLVDAADVEANIRTIANWVDELHEKTDLIVFPRTIVSPPRSAKGGNGIASLAHRHADLLCRFAAKRKVFLATEFLERKPESGQRMLMMADRMGQFDAQSRRLDDEGSTGSASLFINARIAGVRIALASADDLEKQRLAIDANLAKISALIVPLHFAGSAAEVRRIAIHNPPAALPDLKRRLSQTARTARVHVLAANALGEDSSSACGPCGGSFVFNASGEEILSQDILDQTPLEFEIPT